MQHIIYILKTDILSYFTEVSKDLSREEKDSINLLWERENIFTTII